MARLPSAGSGLGQGYGERPPVNPQMGVASIDGTAPGRAQARLGETMMGVGREFQAQVEIETERVDKLRAEDALNKLLDAEQDLSVGEKGYVHVQGEQAATRPLAKEYTERFTEKRTAIAGTLANDRQREVFNQRAQIVARQFGGKLIGHVAKEGLVYEKQVVAGAESAAVTNAGNNYANDDAVDAYLERYNFLRTEHGRKEGEPAEVIDQAKSVVRDKVWTARLTAEAAQNPVAAYARLLLNQDKVSPAAFRQLEAGLFQASDDLLALRAQNAVGASGAPAPSELPATPRATPTGGPEPRGVRNNNPGNIIKSGRQWEGEVEGADPRFASFTTPEDGIKALGRNLLAYNDRHGLDTVEGIVSRWAPASENNTAAYVARVSKDLNVRPDQPLNLRDKATLTALTKSIIAVENGKQPYSDQQISASLDAALTPGVGRVGTERRAEAPPKVSAAVALAAMTPAQALDVKTGDPLIDDLPAHRKLAVLQKAHTLARQDAAQMRDGVQARMVDSIAALERGIEATNAPTQSELILAYGQIDGVRKTRELNEARRFGLDAKAVSTMGPTDQAALVAARAPKEGDGAEVFRRHDQLVTAIDRTNRAKADDPAAFAIEYAPVVRRTFEGMSQATPEARAGATQAFAEATIAEQRRLGVIEPRVLPKSMADAIVREFTAPREGGTPQSAAQFIQAQEKTWGRHWPQVYQQIAKDIGTTARVVSNLRDTPAAALLSMHAQIKTPELKKQIPNDDAKTVDEKVESELEPFRKSVVGWTTGGVTAYNDFDEQAKRLAYVYTSQGTKASEAAQRAARELVGDYYEFRGQTRIPKTVDPRATEAGMTAVLRGADKLGARVPEADAKTLGKDFVAGQIGKALQSKGFFITLGDDSGVALYMEGKNGSRAVEGPDGKAITFTWTDLATRAAQAQREPKAVTIGETPEGAATGRTQRKAR